MMNAINTGNTAHKKANVLRMETRNVDVLKSEIKPIVLLPLALNVATMNMPKSKGGKSRKVEATSRAHPP